MIARCCVCGRVLVSLVGVREVADERGVHTTGWAEPVERAPDEPELRDVITHSYCPECAEKAKKTLDKREGLG